MLLAPAGNTLVYPANEQGHVIVEAVVNGASMRLLVDTGASLVTLTAEDARAAGIRRGELVFNHRVSTANGSVQMAQVTLREVRFGQLSLYDVPAAVLENLNISLLGHEFSLPAAELRDAGRQFDDQLVALPCRQRFGRLKQPAATPVRGARGLRNLQFR